ncbi:MAG: 5'/3'-nucleotidase SurE [Gemmatimonadota bacterium]|uniref:5'/3'-nucleotidase SurE n=1 Tax=Candidatus Palauibacter scopulicola TaxID=3056741 RepID=UPI00238B39D5|nr:5'/3'-nucleotidase SurE [Candidatus Palauibacter scopulicola]MDE2664322.1 5'/3'-nucleotidase SurE [Candidatus Palauibacter scopulicola]
MRTPTPASSVARSLTALSVFGCAAVVSCGGESAAEAVEAAQTDAPYHILVTNDDGIESPGIQALAAALREVGEVTVLAPCSQQSGTSMSISLDEEFRVRATPAGNCADVTPASAVRLAVRVLAPESGFDLVVSGINIGANVGEISHMSGTVGAAMMGAYLGIPAVAASRDSGPGDFEHAAGIVARFVSELRRRGPETGIVYSLNFPAATAAETRGIAARPMGGSYFVIDHEEVTGDPGEETADAEGERRFSVVFVPPETIPAGSDTEAYNEGLVTITPLRFDWTDRPTVEALEGWDLEALLGESGSGG